ncbi:PREDICTED: PRUPE_8G205700 [Prunus dulcis]|uniref:PREDICTED: PRUPE_8G205700 n=1 Tax=Prunus dulcis TaxID=3755 RepID=A0A5E4ELG3_PRUDU|nr:hypothetical protein L3X38_044738 [Prunus dulcis]VVA15870.1 PREDICTED: PRUPE_8G205700 [Prunus dulcis]
MAYQKTECPEEVVKPPQDHQPAQTHIDNNTEEPLLVFKPKPGTVIPARRRLVKAMLVHRFIRVCSVRPPPSSSESRPK